MVEKLRILVTGGLGVVGTPLVQELRKREQDVWVLDRSHNSDAQYLRCDVGEYRQLERNFENLEFDLVYHLAAEFGRANGEDFYETLWKSNAVGMKNMLKIQEKKRFKMIFTSSSEVYGDYRGVMTEEVPLSTPIRQLNDYAITKWVNELQIRNSADRFGSETVILRLFNTYGPGEYYSDYRSVICIFVYRALHRMPYEVFLNHHRSSCYIDDTVRTMANITTNFRPGETYNIAGNEYHDIKTVSDMILEELDLDDSLVKYTDLELHNTLDKKPDIRKASRDLNHHETVDLREGIKRTIEWQKEVYRV